MITHQRLTELFNYNPDTGAFTRKKSVANQKAGCLVGCVEPSGYSQIMVDYKLYRAHRLAWLYVYGYMPENNIDHINRDRADNRICNLREVSQSCNTRNTSNPKDNRSGVKGVTFCKSRSNWESHICVFGKRRKLGYYVDFTDAVCARLAAEQCVGWAGCDSESPAYQYVKKTIKR